MNINVAVCNVEWMVKMFVNDGKLETDDESLRRAEQQEGWAARFGLDSGDRAVQGFPSGGRQELCALYKSSGVDVCLKPSLEQSKYRFNKPQCFSPVSDNV